MDKSEIDTAGNGLLRELQNKAEAGDRNAIRELRHLKMRAFAEDRLLRPHDATSGKPLTKDEEDEK
jgi:hypothetical protein